MRRPRRGDGGVDITADAAGKRADDDGRVDWRNRREPLTVAVVAADAQRVDVSEPAAHVVDAAV